MGVRAAGRLVFRARNGVERISDIVSDAFLAADSVAMSVVLGLTRSCCTILVVLATCVPFTWADPELAIQAFL